MLRAALATAALAALIPAQLRPVEGTNLAFWPGTTIAPIVLEGRPGAVIVDVPGLSGRSNPFVNVLTRGGASLPPLTVMLDVQVEDVWIFTTGPDAHTGCLALNDCTGENMVGPFRSAGWNRFVLRARQHVRWRCSAGAALSWVSATELGLCSLRPGYSPTVTGAFPTFAIVVTVITFIPVDG